MKKFLFLLFFAVASVATAQQKGTLKGLVTDKEANNEPLPFANVILKGTTTGSTTDFDGNYIFQVPEGTHTVIFSFLGYETITKTFTIKAGQTLTINQSMSAAEGVGLDEVVVKASTNKEKETVLLLEQKKAAVIKESIGSVRLSQSGISNVAAATEKISGVTRSESSGSVFIRGLGDRYLLTTMNGLPIPSDDIEKKNVSLSLFPTSIVQNIGVTKTYSVDSYGDQSSGHVDIITKEYSRNSSKPKIGLSLGSNTNVLGVISSFNRSQNANNTNFLGYYNSNLNLNKSITQESWNTTNQQLPLNFKFAFGYGEEFDINDSHRMSIVTSLSHSRSYDYYEGEFKEYRGNALNKEFSMVEEFNSVINTTGLLNVKYEFNSNHNLRFTSLYVNKLQDKVYEQGRDGLGYVLDQQPGFYGAFVRDQNVKQTTIFVNQLFGDHNFGDHDKVNWAVAVNNLTANEPNRIRNEVNFGTEENNQLFPINQVVNPGTVEFAFVGGFQQRKSSQEITDREYNASFNYEHAFMKNENGNFINAVFGGDYRSRTRDFRSQFQGVITTDQARNNDFSVSSIDNLSEAFIQSNFDNGNLELNNQLPDLYEAELDIRAAFINTRFKINAFDINAGLRFEQDIISLPYWNVGNRNPREGSLKTQYNTILPSLNIKYNLEENNILRFVASKTLTLPEFKELAPFNYVSPNGRVTGGNELLIASTNYNIDLKWEYYFEKSGLISVTGFYKSILDPINRTLRRGSSGQFTFSNSGESANVYGAEAEFKKDLIESESIGKLNVIVNAAYMLHEQDLLEEFQFANRISSGLVGASDFIGNIALNYNNEEENAFNANLSANYASDKIYALGAPEDQASSATIFNDEIIEKGFVTLDLILSKNISEKLKINGSFKNLLNPDIIQTQDVTTRRRGKVTETVSWYKKGIDVSLGLSYTF